MQKVAQRYPKNILKVIKNYPKTLKKNIYIFKKYPKNILKVSKKYPKVIRKVSLKYSESLQKVSLKYIKSIKKEFQKYSNRKHVFFFFLTQAWSDPKKFYPKVRKLQQIKFATKQRKRPIKHMSEKKSRIRETKHLSTDADTSTDTTSVGWTKNSPKPNFFEKWKKII